MMECSMGVCERAFNCDGFLMLGRNNVFEKYVLKCIRMISIAQSFHFIL